MAHVQPQPRANGSTAYEVRWRQNGKARQRTFKARRAAERFALRVEAEMEQGKNTQIYSTRSKTVRQVVEATMVIAETKLKPRTVASYRTSYAVHVLPAFGDRRIASLTPEDVEAWVAGLSSQGLKPATIRNTYIALNKACRYALRHGLLAANPCAGVELPKFAADGSPPFAPHFLTPAQVESIARQLDAHAPYGLIVRVAAYTGLRAGELAALRVQDVNVLRRHVEVRRSVQRKKGGLSYTTPKSTRSVRNVPLPPNLVAALTAYLTQHPHRHTPAAALWPGRRPGGYTHGVAADPDGLRPGAVDWTRAFDPGSFYKHYFKPALKAAGVPEDLRFHDLRHTYASIMAAAGVELRKVSRWMGHASISTTDSIYTHLFHTDYVDDMARVDAWVSSAPETDSAVAFLGGGDHDSTEDRPWSMEGLRAL
ncbi:tyrosine-type recombinase/integrase [Streptomyces xinghaiensis]|uniref:tyrosine-type recombinase/integrase n=1 Tax=Streptomyces xinghaiensis TaxID=1038928 RepID=UPI0037BC9B4D